MPEKIDSERTLIVVKPDGVKRGLVGEIIGRFEKRGFKIVELRGIIASEQLIKTHYKQLEEKPFYARLVGDMTSGLSVAMIFSGRDMVNQARKMLGATDPKDADRGTIRGDLAIDVANNVCHASDSIETAESEIDNWFAPR